MTIQRYLYEQNKTWLFEKVRDFVSNKYFKFTKSFELINGFLVFSIDNDQSIHINPDTDVVVLVNNLTGHTKDLLDSQGTTILNHFFTLVSQDITSFKNVMRSKIGGTFVLWSNLYTIPINTQALYLESDLWYYKSIFSGLISTYCFSSSGEYKFLLPERNILHVYISRIYLDDKGVYFLEHKSGKISTYSYEPEISRILLRYLKILSEKPENLKNLA